MKFSTKRDSQSLSVKDKFYLTITNSKGVIMMANTDFHPGMEILRETALLAAPLTTSEFTSQSQELESQTEISEVLWKSYFHFMRQSDSSKSMITELFSPTDGDTAIQLHNQLSNWNVPQEMKNEFVKFAMVHCLNTFSSDEYGCLFELTCRISHSCKPNSFLRVEGKEAIVSALTHIPKGEEITLTYNEENATLPTHERREYLFETKEFVCNCPRCAAMGDDTRQFNCSDPTCAGRHFTCQPTSTDSPYLLPCTVCGQTPSIEYQTYMLKQEASFETQLFDLKRRIATVSANDIALRQSLAAQFLNLAPPSPHHSSAIQLHADKSLYHKLHVNLSAAVDHSVASLSVYEGIITYPTVQLVQMLTNIADMCEELRNNSGDNSSVSNSSGEGGVSGVSGDKSHLYWSQQEQHYRQRAIDTHAILLGADFEAAEKVADENDEVKFKI